MLPARRRAATGQVPAALSPAAILRLLGLLAGVAMAAAVIASWSGSPSAAWTALTTALADRSLSADPTAPVVAAAALAAWACIGWLALLCLLTLASLLPGLTGRTATRLARRCAPWAVRRLLAGTLGVTTLLAAPSAAFAEQLPAAGSPAPTTSTELQLDWPIANPTSPPATATAPTLAPATVPAPTPPATPARVPAPSPTSAPTAPETVIVRPGDSLWTVAARALGNSATPAAVAQAWPSWWAANRDAVGPDPNVIHPGDRLQPPAGPD